MGFVTQYSVSYIIVMGNLHIVKKDYILKLCGSVLNPGTVIGRNTNIYPLSPVRGCVPANSIYKNKDEIVTKN